MKGFTSFICGALLLCGAVAAQEPVIGAEIYARHCATCHGAEARGNGPMAPALVLQPPDLTGLAARHGGVFPAERVVMRIDGRDPLVSHGSPMPVYGAFFEGTDVILKVETGQPVLTSQPVADLLEYLRALQE
ncbi:cytochrome c [uncultured Roseobacter sp.]|uniref:c-type cytochrome n=1 Tax=uncultured Roseobacter sp. TaxID=114847 RepID=UPI0026181D86|nr:cytochrome c [uncultured Roseobacter sp.]